MEESEPRVISPEGFAMDAHSGGQCVDAAPGCWVESWQRHLLPSVMRVESAGGRRSPSPQHFSLTASVEPPPFPWASPAGAIPLLATANDTPPLVSPPQKSMLPQRIKVSLGRRWQLYVNGAIQRYDVPARVRGWRPRNDEQESPFRFLEEIEQLHRDERTSRHFAREEFAPKPPPPAQFTVCMPDADPRLVADEVNAKPKTLANAEIPTELQERKALFHATLGAVKPYALGENSDQRKQQKGRRRRPGDAPLAMPQSAVTRDPMEVFIEAMRYQRPALGVYSFDVY